MGYSKHKFNTINMLYPLKLSNNKTPPDPDPEISGGGRSSRTLDKGGGSVFPKIFLALQASVWWKNKGRGRDPPGPSTGFATVSDLKTYRL